MKRKIVGVEEFVGLETHIERSERRGAQKDQNSDRRIRGLWRVRKGFADTGLVDGTSRIESVGWGACTTGNVLLLESAGSISGTAIPAPTWTSV